MLPRLRLRWFFPTGFRRQTRTASRCVQRRYSPLRLPKNALHPSVSDCGSRSDAAALNLLHAAVYRAVRVGSVNALRTRTDCRIAGYGSEIDIHLAAVKQCLFGNAVVDNVNNAAAFDNSLPRRSRNFLSAAAETTAPTLVPPSSTCCRPPVICARSETPPDKISCKPPIMVASSSVPETFSRPPRNTVPLHCRREK